MAKKGMIKCKSCDAEIAASAKTCPKCGAKNSKPFYKKVWFWVVIAIVLIIIGAGSGSEEGENNTPINSNEPAAITYQKVTIEELIDAKNENAAAAKDTYNKKYIEFSGKLGTIDSDLKYIAVEPFSSEYWLSSIHCSITSNEQKDIIKTLKKGDSITIRGKVTDVGEVLGYYVDIKEVLAE